MRAARQLAVRLASALAYLLLALIVFLEFRPAAGIPAIPFYYLLPLSILAWFRGWRSAVLAGSSAFLVTLAASLWGGMPASGWAIVSLARLLTFAFLALIARGLNTGRLMLDFLHRGAAWRALQKPMRVGRRLLVVPVGGVGVRGNSTRLGPNVLALYIQPDLAFGTSSHPTTRMCLELLEQHMRTGLTVLDVGCGTGILAIAAAKLGAAHVQAIDIDLGAIQVARQNLAHNRITDKVTLAHGSIEVVTSEGPRPAPDTEDHARQPSPHPGENRFDLVLANVPAGVIRELIKTRLSLLLGREGVLITSGIRSGELESVQAAILAAGLRPERVMEEDGWCAIVAQVGRPASASMGEVD
jgi:ribosomal protein L11 methyltransferase